MAEAIFRVKVQQQGLADEFEIDSAGTGSWHVGEAPHPGTRQVLHTHAIPFQGILARQVKPEDIRNFDWILVMDDANWRDVSSWDSNASNIHKVLEFSEGPEQNVPDPFFTGGFGYVYALLDKALDNFLRIALSR